MPLSKEHINFRCTRAITEAGRQSWLGRRDGDDKCTCEVGGGDWVTSGHELLEARAVLYSFIPATAHSEWGKSGDAGFCTK